MTQTENIADMIKRDYPNITPAEYKRVYSRLYYQMNKADRGFMDTRNKAGRTYYLTHSEKVKKYHSNLYNENPLYYRALRMEAHNEKKNDETYLLNRRLASKKYYATHREELKEWNTNNYHLKKSLL